MMKVCFNGLPPRRYEKKDVRITIHTTQSINNRLDQMSLKYGLTKNGLINLILESINDWFNIS